MHGRAARLVAGFALAFAASSASAARGELQAGPTLLELPPGASSARLRLGNGGDAVVAAQVRIYRWTQVDGEDVLQETDLMVASPPIAEVPAGGEHLVRIVRPGNAPVAGRDETYRAVVDELPGPPDDASTGVQVRMRYVIPVFVRAAGATPPAVTCRVFVAANRIACRNDGGQPAQLGATTLASSGPALSLSEGLYGYVLPGSERHWALPSGRHAFAGPLTLDTRINGQPATVAVERLP